MRPRRLFSRSGFVLRPNRRISIEYLEDRVTPVGSFPDLALDYGGFVAPALPGNVDVFAPTVIPATSIPAAAPDFGEWTRTSSPRQSLTITGAEFTQLTGASAGTDTKFWVFAQTATGNGVLTQATIQHLEGGEGAIVTLPGTLPANSMILLWAENSQGVSKPVAINQTEAWWIGPDKAQAGQSIAIFGQNLSRTGGEWKTGDAGLAPASVWIEPASGGSGQWVAVTAVNPYRVDFNLPANLALGTYRAWIHNGRGGAYGWGKPLTFEVRSAAANVTSFVGPVIDASLPRVVGGVTVQITPNDSTDDAVALQAAFDAAKVLNLGASGPVYPTIVLPAGTYLVGTSLYLPSNVRLQGAGKDVTILKAIPSATFTNSLIFGGVQTNGVEIRDVTLHSGYDPLLAGANLYTGGISSVLRLDSRQDVRITNVKIDARATTAFYSSRTERLFLTNCDFISNGSFLDRNKGVFIDNCRFWETNNAAYAISNWGGERLSITNCIAESESLADPSRDAGWGLRFFTSSRGGKFEYLARNTTRNLGNRPDVEGNVGEHILWETSNSFFVGSPVVVAGSQFVVADLRDFPFGDGYEYNVVVVDGPGTGQTRQISAYDPATNLLTVAEPWGVPIATDSVLSITRLAHHIVVYKNDLKGLAENVTRAEYNGSAGIVLFGAAANFVIDGNTVTDIRRPISIWAMSDTPGQSQLKDPRQPLKLVEPSVFNLVVNNTVNNAREGITLYMTAGDEIADNSPIGDYSPLVGNIIRGNTVRGSLTFGLGIGYLRSQSDWRSSMTVDVVVFEGNVVSNLPVGIHTNVSLTGGETPATDGPSVRSAVFLGNSFTRGTAAFTGSRGIVTGGGQAPLLKNNAFNSFQTTYGGVFPVSASVIAGPTAKAREYSFTVTATDIFLDADVFSFDVDWNYDGTFDQSATAVGSSWTVTRTFAVAEAPGLVPVRFRVTSPNNISLVVQLTIDPAQRNVYYLGSERADAAGLVETTNRTVIVGLWTMGGRSVTTARMFGQVTGVVSANLGDGPDFLSAESLATVSVYANGGSYSDTLTGGAAADSIDGGDGPDSLLGGNGDDTLVGGNHRDTLRGGKGDDLLNGSFGSDEYDYASDDGGNDTILEPASMDNDWLDFSGFPWAVTITPTSVLAKNSANQTVLSITLAESTAIESIVGTPLGDVITGNTRANRIYGGDGNDTISAGGGNDIVIGGGGNDSLDGGDGDDFLDGGLGSDQIFGGLGNETIFGGDGDDQIQGQEGDDLIDGGEGNDIIQGQDGNDSIDAGGDNDQIDGGAGNDMLNGSEGADVVAGGDGDDSIAGGAGNDTLLGGAGNDVYFFTRAASLTKLGSDMVIEDPAASDVSDMLDFSAFSLGIDAVTVNLAASDGVVLDLGDKLRIAVYPAYGSPANASGVEAVSGTDRGDVILGNARNNLLFGNGGNDSLSGGDGRDILHGGDGADTLLGGNGDDILIAGSTTYNANTGLAAWLAIKAEWESARTFTARISNISGNNPSTRLNGNYFLNSASLIDDALVDSVAGGANADWCLLDYLEDVLAGFDGSDVLYNIRA